MIKMENLPAQHGWRWVMVCCLVCFASCDGSSSSGVVGYWADASGRTMVFEPGGRVVIRGPNVSPRDGTFTYLSGVGEVRITLNENGGTIHGKLLTSSRLQMTSDGRPFIFSRRGSR
jgi:hypothetical protein